ncbi:MAG: hypothetical protein HZC54_02495 [Verrucomicrobia bacterium]|nr:hypothetical protein [Verrucomicrobiota bacterium]
MKTAEKSDLELRKSASVSQASAVQTRESAGNLRDSAEDLQESAAESHEKRADSVEEPADSAKQTADSDGKTADSVPNGADRRQHQAQVHAAKLERLRQRYRLRRKLLAANEEFAQFQARLARKLAQAKLAHWKAQQVAKIAR